MSKYVINDSTLVAIGDAVREKDGTTAPIVVSDLANRIKAIPSGGGELPEEALTISGSCNYRFANGGWDWFIEEYGNRIKTEKINIASYMFANSSVEYIPFDINCTKSFYNLSYMFQSMSKLKELPRLKAEEKLSLPTSKTGFLDLNGTFYAARCIREIPEDYFDSIVSEGYWEHRETLGANGEPNAFNYMYSLRKVSPRLYIPFRNYGTYASASYVLYNSVHQNNYSLDEVTNLPVEKHINYNGNVFTKTVDNCYRLARLTFETNEDGSPMTANWKAQVIDLTKNVGTCPASMHSQITTYNSGITDAKKVTDLTSYEELKNDLDWFSTDVNFSRYNKISAIETISTLPDTSAYVAQYPTQGNTIKFTGAAGASTDGGAINTMTEEEIAVATAKGWTVSYV